MTKANKIVLLISIILLSISILVGGCFLGLSLGSHLRHNDMEAEVGNEKEMETHDHEVKNMAVCGNCGGTGRITCSSCNGVGECDRWVCDDGCVFLGGGCPCCDMDAGDCDTWEYGTCPDCNGSGGARCTVCNGTGAIPDIASTSSTYVYGNNTVFFRLHVFYNTTLISSVSISNFGFNENGGLPKVVWGTTSTTALTVNLQSGCSWKTSQISIPVYYSAANSSGTFYTNPSGYTSWGTTTTITSNRTNNNFIHTNCVLRIVASEDYKYYSFVVDLTAIDFIAEPNYWVEQPSFSSYEYGQTPPTPTGYAAVSENRKVYYRNLDLCEYDDYLNATYGEDWLAYTVDGYGDSLDPPTDVGRYRCDIYDGPSGSRLHAQIYFYVYVPTPTVQNVYWTGSSITATPTYNSTFVNYPSGNTGTNVGSYTATFTINSNSQTYWQHTVYVYEESGDEWEEYYDIPRTVLFSNGTTSYSVSWQIQKQQVVIPSVSGSFTYDGTSKSAAIGPSIYVQSHAQYVNQTGTASATNAGTYTITFALKNTGGCQWTDGTTTNKTGSWTIARAAVATKPTASGGTSFTYTGSAINFGVSNYNTAYMTRSGTYQSTNVGSYSVTYTLKSNYAWTDGTTGAVTLNWNITQATNSWTSSPSITSWTYGSAPSTINVGTPKFGSNMFSWYIVNADIFEMLWVEVQGYTYFDVNAHKSSLESFDVTDDDENGSQFFVYDYTVGSVSCGNDPNLDDYYWSSLPPGRYYIYSGINSGGWSLNYTIDNIFSFREFYVYAPKPTVTNNSQYTYNGSPQGPTVSGNTAYYTLRGDTSWTNASSSWRYMYVQAKCGTDSYSGYDYPYYFSGYEIDAFLEDMGYDSLAETYNWEGVTAENIAYGLSIQYSYKINPKDISGGTITITPTDYTYDGAVHKPTVTVTVP